MFHTLELKVPPLAVAIVFGALMWLVSTFSLCIITLPWRSGFALMLYALGSSIVLAGMLTFFRMNTTVNPLTPEATTTMVTSGIYRVIRNPMYLGFLLILVGWAIALSNLLAFAWLPLFVLYMNRFQILPEERALASKFPEAFTLYRHSVRRWI